MHTMKIDSGGFLYPIKESDGGAHVGEASDAYILQQHYKLSKTGYGGVIHVLGIRIPRAEEESLKERHEAFRERMREVEEALLGCLKKANL